MADASVFIDKIMESAEGIPAEVPAVHKNDVHKISGIYRNNVSRCADGISPAFGKFGIERIFSVYIIVEVTVMSAPEAVKIKASRSTLHLLRNFLAVSVAIFIMCIKIKMKSGDIFFSVTVFINCIFGKPVIGKFYFFQFGNCNRNMRHNRSVASFKKFVIKAYGKINVLFLRHCRYREHSHCHYHSKEKR